MGENKSKGSKISFTKKVSMFIVVLSSIFIAALTLLEMYIFINDSLNYLSMFIVAILMLLNIIFLVNSFIYSQNRKQENIEKILTEIDKSQRAFYILNKKNFQLIEARINQLEEQIKDDKEELVSAPKLVGKVVLNRFGEHAEAVMNATSKVIDLQVETNKLLSQTDPNEIVQIQKAIGKKNDDLDQIYKKIDMIVEKISNLNDEEEPDRIKKHKIVTKKDKKDLTKSQDKEDIIKTEDKEDISLKELENSIVYNEIDLDNSIANEENLLEQDFSSVEEKISGNEKEFPNLIIEESEDKKAHPLTEEKDTKETNRSNEKPPMPDLSDASRKMTEEEIAALIANL